MRKKWKWTLGLVFCLVMTLAMVPGKAFAAEITARGTCGDNIKWTLDDEGTLTIDGWGEMNACPNYCAEEYIQEIKKAVISGGITNIGEAAFLRCKNLESVTMPDSVTRIDDMAFCECYNLKDVKIPADVTSIGEYGFDGCSSLESITIPANVESIGARTFNGCIRLESITIPANVKSIGAVAFGSCRGLKSIVFAGITPPEIDPYAFAEVITTAYYPANNTAWKNAIDNGYGIGYGDNLKWEASHLMHDRGVWPGYAATCTKDGLTDGVMCLTCHELVEKGEVIPAKGHKGVYRDNEAEATCCTEGVKRGGAECKVCGEELIEDTILPIDPNNHKNIVTDKSVKATSTKTGLTAGSHCRDCGKVIKKQTLTLAKPVLTSDTKNIARKKIVVKWKKNSTCTGYQVKYVTGSTTKTVKVSGKSTLSKTLKRLKKGKTYKVYVRCYKTVGSKTYYSPYSAYKSVKVTK